MKNFLISCFLLLSINLFSQGILQFNQVLILDATVAGNAVTIPAGKVWKIESVAMTSNNSYFQIQWGGSNYFVIKLKKVYPWFLHDKDDFKMDRTLRTVVTNNAVTDYLQGTDTIPEIMGRLVKRIKLRVFLEPKEKYPNMVRNLF